MPKAGGGGSSALPAGFGFLAFGLDGSLANGTIYVQPFGYSAGHVTEANLQWPIPVDCTLRNLYVHLGVAPVAPAVHTVTVRLNRSSSASDLAVTLNAANGLNVSDLVNTMSAKAGDLLSLQIVTVLGAGVSFNTAQISVDMY